MKKINYDLRKRNRKLDRFGIIYLGLITAFILMLFLFISMNSYVFGSYTDWISQHSVLPEYFRQYFYATGDLIPKFNMNLGAGQNGYNIAYYGLLNPVIIVSYLFPDVKMYNYIVFASLVVLIMGVYLFYYWMRNMHMRQDIAAVATAIYAFASPLFYHSHRQVMFVSYFPFLIMALIGVDRFYKKKRRDLISISILLIILTSYYYSIGCILVITLYAVFRFYERNEFYGIKSTFKDFFKVGCSYALSVIAGVLMAMILLLPTFMAVVGGREQNTGENYLHLYKLLPDFNIMTSMYDSYGLGFSAIILISTIFLFYRKRFSYKFLSGIMVVVITCPILRIVLNLGLYDRSKALFPFIPLGVLTIAYFIEDLIKNKINVKPLIIVSGSVFAVYVIYNIGNYRVYFFIADMVALSIALLVCILKNKRKIIYVYAIISSGIICAFGYFGDSFMKKDYMEELWSEEREAVIKEVLDEDEEVYRMNNLNNNRYTCNLVYDIRYYQTSIYSSVYNKDYNIFIHDTINLSNPTVNKISAINSNNALFQTFMGVKYIVTTSVDAPVGYELHKEEGNNRVFVNNDVYSLGFATSSTMNKNVYNSLNSNDKQAALLKYIVHDDGNMVDYESDFETLDIQLDFGEQFKVGGKYFVELSEDRNFKVDLSDYDYDIYAIDIMIGKIEDKKVEIIINGIRNNLSGKYAAFINNNYDFSYIVSSADDLKQLDITMKAGDYIIEGYIVRGLKYEDMSSYKDNFDMMYDIEVRDDGIAGSIDVREDGFFNVTIPYDDAFTLYVDGEETEIIKTDDVFMGCKIAKGTHRIEFVYEVPGYFLGAIGTIIGCTLFIMMIVYDFMKMRCNKK